MLQQYGDLLANVRRDGIYHSIRDLIRPNDPLVQEIADVLIQTNDFIGAAQDFVDSFTTYEDEIGDYWGYPMETLAFKAGDCDDKAILLCSILRNYLPADEIFCAIGLWSVRGKEEGHMWDLFIDQKGKQRIIEATAPASRPRQGKYTLGAIFNDCYAFATTRALKEFALIPVPIVPELVPELVTAGGYR